MAEESKNKRQTPEKRPKMLLHTFYGMAFSSEFFKRYWRIVLCVVFVSILHITNRYLCITRIQIVNELESKSKAMNSRALAAKGEYLASTREKSMRQLVDSLNLNLEVSKSPNIVLKYDAKGQN